MRRQPKTGGEIWKHRTLFSWARCCQCKLEFRRENGWRKLTGPYHGGRGVWRHVCESCAPNRERAVEILEHEHPWHPKMPKVLPTPPPPPPTEWHPSVSSQAPTRRLPNRPPRRLT